MAITKRMFVERVTVLEDGQVEIVERTQYFDEGFVVTSRKDIRLIDVGDDVAAESELIKDVVDGKLHKKSRKDARDAAKLAEIEKAKGNPPGPEPEPEDP